MVAGISPLVTFDRDQRIYYFNPSFQEVFGTEIPELKGSDLCETLSLSPSERTSLLEKVKRSEMIRVENSTFTSQGRTFGYTIFRFDDKIGILMKDVSQIIAHERKISGLYSHLLKLQEKDHQKLAADLHDSAGQTILAAKLNFLAYDNDPHTARSRFTRGLELIDQASQELRDIYTNLYPSALKELNLEAAVLSFARDFLELSSIKPDFKINIPDDLDASIDPEKKTNIFRIVQEALTNIVKHSGADKTILTIQAREDGKAMEIYIQDNGQGFKVEDLLSGAGGYGLENIRRRIDDMKGFLEIDTAPGNGTRLKIELPLP